MDLIRVSAFAHIFFNIVLMGLALYWLLMESALRRRHGTAEAQRLLDIANHARWPHVGVPPALRIPLPWMSWLTIAGLVVTGAPGIVLRGIPAGGLWWLKLALFLAIVIVQVPLTRTPNATLIRVNFVLVAAAIVVSGWAIR